MDICIFYSWQSFDIFLRRSPAQLFVLTKEGEAMVYQFWQILMIFAKIIIGFGGWLVSGAVFLSG